MKKIYIITALLFCSLTKLFAQPSAAAVNPPARVASNYVSLYGSSYTNIGGTDFYPGWGQTTAIAEFIIGMDTMIKYSNFNYQGIQLAANTDVSNMSKLHLDVWTSDATEFKVSLINTTPAPTVEQEVVLTPTLSGWNSFDIDLSLYTNIALNRIGQIKLVTAPFGGAPGPTVYLDNIYFYKLASAPTISNFNIPAKNLGNAPFIISTPTSNSPGTFSYTSSNLSVATVVGNTITIVGIGNTTITANQAASGAFTAGTIATTFVVNSGLAASPTTAAPTPTKAQANVISLFSNAYTNRPVDTWSTVWDAADVADTVIAGNDTKKYTNLVFSGIEFVGPNKINVTNADFFHVDIWTPNASSLKIKLVDFGANGIYAGGDDKEHELTLNAPAFSQWVSYDIPMSDFTGLTTKANLAQMLFVSTSTTVYFDNVFFWANTAVLPVTLKTFTATKKENNVFLNWNVSNEVNLVNYQVQKSIDGISFETISSIKATNSNTYNYIDSKVSNTTYYRLKMNDNNGKFSYSKIVAVNATNESGISVYPNPAKNFINVSVKNIETSKASLNIVDITGKIVKSITVNNTNSNVQIDISSLSKGLYTIVLFDTVKKNASTFIVD